MTYEEAIKHLEDRIIILEKTAQEDYGIQMYREALKKAVTLMKMQTMIRTPQAPIETPNAMGINTLLCPVCKKPIGYNDVCQFCGAPIDWGF